MDDFDQMTQMMKNLGKRAGSKIARHLFKVLLPYLPVIALLLLIFFLIVMLIAATYSAMSSSSMLTGINPSSEDSALKAEYRKEAYHYGNINTWQVGDLVSPGDETTGEPVGSPFYKKGRDYRGYKNLYPNPKGSPPTYGDQSDRYGYAAAQSLTWGMLHAMNLYLSYNFNQAQVSEKMIEPLAKMMQPYFFFKYSQVITITVTPKKTTRDVGYVWLLTEAYTVYGHHEYFYKWETKTYGKAPYTTTITQEVPAKTVSLPSKYFLRTFNQLFKTDYQSNDDREFSIARQSIFGASTAFTDVETYMSWLMVDALGGTHFINGPVKVYSYSRNILRWRQYIDRYAREYALPPALVAGIMAEESGGDPYSDNGIAYGLMQLTQDKFTPQEFAEWYAPDLNVHLGCEYIRYLADTLGYPTDFWDNQTDLQDVIAAYNAGPGAVEEYGGIPPYQETETYVPAVLQYYAQFQSLLAS